MWVYPVLESIIALRTTSSIMHRSVLVQSYFFPPGIGFQTLIKRIVHFFHERVKGLHINILKKMRVCLHNVISQISLCQGEGEKTKQKNQKGREYDD